MQQVQRHVCASHLYMNLKGLYRNLCKDCGDIDAFALHGVIREGAICRSAALQSALSATNICSSLCIEDASKASCI